MPDDDSMLGQNEVDVRNEVRRNAQRGEQIYVCRDSEGQWIADQREQAEEDDDDLPCGMCGGEGHFFGEDLPGFSFGWHDPDGVYDCPSCNGSGARRDMTIW